MANSEGGTAQAEGNGMVPVKDTDDPMVETFNKVRKSIKEAAANVALLRRTFTQKPGPIIANGEDRGEVIANIVIAFRALEDASMRMGKAIQARDGGVSVYDQSTAVMNDAGVGHGG